MRSPEQYRKEVDRITPYVVGLNVEDGERSQRKRGNKFDDGFFDIETQVFMFHEFIGSYPTLRVLRMNYGIAEPDICRLLRRMQNAYFNMFATVQYNTIGFNDAELDPSICEDLWAGLDDVGLEEEQVEQLRRCTTALDGTEIIIARPSASHETQKSHFSAKKRQHSLGVQAIVSLEDGTCVYLSDAENVHHDQRAFIDQGIRDLYVGKGFGVLVDGGYFPNRKNPPEGEVPIFAAKPYTVFKKRGGLTENQILFNTQLSKRRVIVENFFSRLKKYYVVGTKYRAYSANASSALSLTKLVNILVNFVNENIVDNPLRAEGWEPDMDEGNSAVNSGKPRKRLSK